MLSPFLDSLLMVSIPYLIAFAIFNPNYLWTASVYAASAIFGLIGLYYGYKIINKAFNYINENIFNPIIFWFGVYRLRRQSKQENYENLIQAIEDGNDFKVRQLLKTSINPVANDNYALRKSVANNEITIFNLLVNIPDVKKNIAANDNEILFSFLQQGEYKSAKIMLSYPEIISKLKDPNIGLKYLKRIIKSKNIELIRHSFEIDCILSLLKENYGVLLLKAYETQDLSTVYELYNTVIPSSAINKKYGDRFIKIAANLGWSDLFKQLYKLPHLKEKVQQEDNMILKMAAENGHIEIVELLVQDFCISHFFVSYYKDRKHKLNSSMQGLYLDKSIKLNTGINFGNELVEACKNNDAKVVKIILDTNVLWDISRKKFKKSLKYAIKNKNSTIKQMLLANDKLTKDLFMFDGIKILKYAVNENDWDLFEDLQEKIKPYYMRTDKQYFAEILSGVLDSPRPNLLLQFFNWANICTEPKFSSLMLRKYYRIQGELIHDLINNYALTLPKLNKLLSIDWFSKMVDDFDAQSIDRIVLLKNAQPGVLERLMEFNNLRANVLNYNNLMHKNGDLYNIAHRIEHEKNKKQTDIDVKPPNNERKKIKPR